MFDTATHRDFLGAVLNLGISRTVVGDILVQGDKGAFIMTTPEIVPFLETQLMKVSPVLSVKNLCLQLDSAPLLQPCVWG